MPSISCDCQSVIEKEGLAFFLKDTFEAIFGYADFVGIPPDLATDLVAQLTSHARVGIVPIAVQPNQDWSDAELKLVGFYCHMIKEIQKAGYSPRAFFETLVVDVFETSMSGIYGC